MRHPEPTGRWSWDYRTDTGRCNATHARLMGQDPQARPLTAAAFLEQLHPDDAERFYEALLSLVEDGGRLSTVCRVMVPWGGFRTIHMTLVSRADPRWQTVRISARSRMVNEGETRIAA